MKKFLFAFLVMVCGCVNTSKESEKMVEAYFFSGDSDDSPIVNASDTLKTDSAVIHEITIDEYNFLLEVANKHKTETMENMRPPGIYIKMDSIQYMLGDNRVVKVGRKKFLISERDEYRIKSIIHYYDFMCHESVTSCSEVRRYGIPANYRCVIHGENCIPRDRKLPLKVLVYPRPPLKKIILRVG